VSPPVGRKYFSDTERGFTLMRQRTAATSLNLVYVRRCTCVESPDMALEDTDRGPGCSQGELVSSGSFPNMVDTSRRNQHLLWTSPVSRSLPREPFPRVVNNPRSRQGGTEVCWRVGGDLVVPFIILLLVITEYHFFCLLCLCDVLLLWS
jgi:hypothetical protein